MGVVQLRDMTSYQSEMADESENKTVQASERFVDERIMPLINAAAEQCSFTLNFTFPHDMPADARQAISAALARRGYEITPGYYSTCNHQEETCLECCCYFLFFLCFTSCCVQRSLVRIWIQWRTPPKKTDQGCVSSSASNVASKGTVPGGPPLTL